MIQTIKLALTDFKDIRPLFNEVWNEIVKPYPGKPLEWILENVHNKIIPKRTIGEFTYNMPGEVEQPVKYTPGQSIQTETELEAFLNNILTLETCRYQHIKLDEAFDNVNRLPDVLGIRQLKEILLKNIEYLQKNKSKIGRFEIIPDVKEIYKKIRFNDFDSFSKEFLKRAMPIFKHGKLPAFVFGWTSYSDLVSRIDQIAMQIRHYYNNEEFEGKNLGTCFLEVYNLARWFERSHYQLYDSDIIDRADVRAKRRDAANKTNREKQECYPRMKTAASKIATEHPNFSISQAADKLSTMFPISTKIIKEQCKVELAPLNKKIKK